MQNTSYLYHARRTLVLAWPMILSRVGLVTMSMMDVIVLGRAGAEELANYVLGQAIYDSLIAMSVGLMLGVPVLVAREMGAENAPAAPVILRRGLVLALALGLGLCALLQFAGGLYMLTGQSAELAARAASVTRILGLALPLVGLYYVCASYLEAQHRPMPGFVAIACANVLNLLFNIVLVLGLGPFPALGAPGCAMATVFTFALSAIGLMIYLRRDIRGRLWSVANVPPVREMVRIGLASGSSFLFEATAFAVLVLIIGRLGPLALAAHGVLFQFLAFTFMIAFGIAAATQVRVGNAWGRQDASGMARAGWTGLALSTLATGALTLVFALEREGFVRFFTTDEAVVAAALPVFFWIMLATIFDGGQTVMNSACRGRGDTWVPTGLHFLNYAVVMVPSAWVLAISFGQGLAGIYQGILLASVLSVGLMALRFHVLTQRLEPRTTG
ncbi:MATE family efflux transporter [Amaricoccus macauensis]|uniref:MATE family efflux transporter n=1 Tax=Amaricoccus macauensis TaxID=57001 RepID=UPI003C7D773C